PWLAWFSHASQQDPRGPTGTLLRMDEWDALWAFLVAAAIALVATPVTARFARRFGVVHYPRERDLHDHPVPRLGGLAILVAAVIPALIFLPAGQQTRG